MPGLKATEQKIWILQYEHKHGTDLSAHDSEKAVHSCMVGIINDQFEDDDKSTVNGKLLLTAMETDDLGNISSLWQEVTGGNEYFNWDCVNLNTVKTALDAMAEAVHA